METIYTMRNNNHSKGKLIILWQSGVQWHWGYWKVGSDEEESGSCFLTSL